MDVLPTRISQYEIRHVLGQGGMGTVFLAVDPALQRPVALKVLRSDSQELRERFRREARLIARLQHPNIVAIYTVGEHEDQPFLAMEYIDGEPLSEGIRRRAPWGLQRKLMMGVDLCAGLAFAHRAGVIHRDVKPSNLMVSHGSGVVRLLDFGIARGDDAAATHGLTLHGNIVGTMNYMSPEQITGQPVDHRSDIFAVGLVLYELFSYCQAFPGSNLATLTYRIVHGQAEPLQELEPTLDPELCAVVARAMARDPADRYPHLEALRTELLRIAARLSPTAAAALATDGATSRPDTPMAPPIWSRALDPTVDSAGPVTPASTAPIRSASPDVGGFSPSLRPRWLVPIAATGLVLGATSAVWLGWPVPPRRPTSAPERPAVTRPLPSAPIADPASAAARDAAPKATGRDDAGHPGPDLASRAGVTARREPREAPVPAASVTDRAERPSVRPEAPPTTNDSRQGDTAAAIEPRATPIVTPPDSASGETAPRGDARPETPAAPPPAGPSDAEQVQAIVGRWARAYAARDARGIDAVMPGAEATYARQFSGLRSSSTTLGACQVSIEGARATAACTEQYAFELTVGGASRGTRQRRFVLDKGDGAWRIVSTSVSQ